MARTISSSSSTIRIRPAASAGNLAAETTSSSFVVRLQFLGVPWSTSSPRSTAGELRGTENRGTEGSYLHRLRKTDREAPRLCVPCRWCHRAIHDSHNDRQAQSRASPALREERLKDLRKIGQGSPTAIAHETLIIPFPPSRAVTDTHCCGFECWIAFMIRFSNACERRLCP
jgi:hypothetical protein